MDSYALYRLPGEDECRLIAAPSERVVSLADLSQLEGMSGYVVMPFHVSVDTPLLVIPPDRNERFPLDELFEIVRDLKVMAPDGDDDNRMSEESQREAYHKVFELFHERVCSAGCSKLVLSHSLRMGLQEGRDALSLFVSAARRYPEAFVSLFFDPRCGMWLVASPEILLRADGTTGHTIALAGTMAVCGDEPPEWSQKNLREQTIVAEYIHDAIRSLGVEAQVDGPATARAGHLLHLRTDFTFPLAQEAVGRLLSALHPTPAVCGLPKEMARRFILDHEGYDRRYYSGFSGPLALDGATALYVTLRCVEMHSDAATLYAGGGLLPESTEQSEWEEIMAKMDTMRSNLIDTN